MATYLNMYAMQANASFIQQVTVACRIAAQNIINEAASTPSHAARMAWAALISKGQDVALANMVSGAAMNSTLQASAPAGPWLDSDIQFVVNSLVSLLIV